MEERYSIAELMRRMRRNWPETATIETELVLGLIRFAQLAQEGAHSHAARFDLSPAGFEVLTTLRALDPPRRLSPTELYRSILITSGGMTKVLKNLQAQGWITREDNPDDKRSKLVCLTKAGEARAEAVMAAVAESDRKLLAASLTDREMTELRDILLPALAKIEAD